jgi:hypothetical protein
LLTTLFYQTDTAHDEARHVVDFDFKALDHDVRGARDRFDMQMIGQRLKLGDNTRQQPPLTPQANLASARGEKGRL